MAEYFFRHFFMGKRKKTCSLTPGKNMFQYYWFRTHSKRRGGMQDAICWNTVLFNVNDQCLPPEISPTHMIHDSPPRITILSQKFRLFARKLGRWATCWSGAQAGKVGQGKPGESLDTLTMASTYFDLFLHPLPSYTPLTSASEPTPSPGIQTGEVLRKRTEEIKGKGFF